MPPLALLTLLAVSPALAAVRMPDCVKPGEDGKIPTLDAVRSCQERQRKRLIADYEKRERESTPAWLHEKIDTHQRGEIRDFLADHPERASFSHSQPQPPSQKEQSADILSLLKSYFGKAASSLQDMIGKAKKKKSSASDQEAAQSLKAVTDAAKKSGLDLKKHRTNSLFNPGGTLKKKAAEYNKSLDKNLDPSMKKFFKGGKKKK